LNVGTKNDYNKFSNIVLAGGRPDPYIALGQTGTVGTAGTAGTTSLITPGIIGYDRPGIFMGLFEDGVNGTSGRLSIKSSGGSGTRGIFWDGDTLTIKGHISQTAEGGYSGRNMGSWAAGVKYYNLDQVTYGGYSWSSNAEHTSTNNTNAGTGYPGSGPWSLSPYAAKSIRQSASAQVFTELKDGTLTPNFIQFSAAKENITSGTTWSTSPSVTLYNASTGGSVASTGDTVYLRKADFGTNQLVEVTSTSDGKTDKISVVRVKEGSDALTIVLTNEAHTVAAANDGTVSSYAGSGTDIYVYEGATQLDYDGIGTAAGKWTVTAAGTNVTPGALSDGGNYASMAVVSAMSANQALVTFTISGKKLNGTAFSGITKIQSLTKSIKGADGVSGAATAGAGIVFRGLWKNSTLYYKNANRIDVVKIPSHTGGLLYWLARNTHTSAADGPPSSGAGPVTNWESFGANFDSVATDILFADMVYADQTVNIGSNGLANIISLNADKANSNANPYISIGQTAGQGYGNAGIFLGYDGGVGKLSVTSGLIGGWVINSSTITSPGATPRMILNPSSTTPSIKINDSAGTERVKISTGTLSSPTSTTGFSMGGDGITFAGAYRNSAGAITQVKTYVAAATSLGTVAAGTYEAALTYNWISSPGTVVSIEPNTAAYINYYIGYDILDGSGNVQDTVYLGSANVSSWLGNNSSTYNNFGLCSSCTDIINIVTTGTYYSRPFYGYTIVWDSSTKVPAGYAYVAAISLTLPSVSFGRINKFTEISEEGIQVVSSTSRYVRISTNTGTDTDALYVKGDFTVGGGTKTFKIDHPLDNTKYLMHSVIESPKADNIYRGKIELINGYAEINLDVISNMMEGTWVKLNRDTQFFLQNMNGWDNVKGEVIGNTLYIYCENTESTDLISYMVIGERQDDEVKQSYYTDDDGHFITEVLKQIE
jgi:hypothetical protein